MWRARKEGLHSTDVFFNDTATTEIYTLSLHDALPICDHRQPERLAQLVVLGTTPRRDMDDAGALVLAHLVPGHDTMLVAHGDRKSTRLNSSHANISYAVFCLKKKHC